MIYVLHHADSDGRFAGYAAWRYFQNKWTGAYSQTDGPTPDSVRYIEVQYGKPFPLKLEELTEHDQIYILDFSYAKEILDPINQAIDFLIVLDHHESGVENLAGAPYGIFDMTKSGALLAWEYFFPNQEPPLACLLVNDRDLWKWEYKEKTAAFETWLHYDRVGQNWEKWHELSTRASVMELALERGAFLSQYNDSILNSFIKNPDNISIRRDKLMKTEDAPKVIYAVYTGIYILASELASEIYNKLGVDLTIDWRAKEDLIKFSVRSKNPAKISAKEFCKQYGGGGHPASASFALPTDAGLNLVQYFLNAEK